MAIGPRPDVDPQPEPSRNGQLVPWDLLVAAAWLAAAVASAPAGGLPAVWLLQVPALGLCLGYLATFVLFPADEARMGGFRRMGLPERAAVAGGLSIALLVLLGVGLAASRAFDLTALRVGVAVVGGVLLILAIGQWYSLPRELRWTPIPARIAWRPSSFDLVLLGVAILAVVALVIAVVRPPPTEYYTELYLLGPEGTADCYPDMYSNGTYRTSSVGCAAHAGNITVGVRNLERQVMDYVLRVSWVVPADADGGEAGTTGIITEGVRLDPTDGASSFGPDYAPQFEVRIDLDSPPPGTPARLLVELFKGEEDEPSRTLHLWVRTVS